MEEDKEIIKIKESISTVNKFHSSELFYIRREIYRFQQEFTLCQVVQCTGIIRGKYYVS